MRRDPEDVYKNHPDWDMPLFDYGHREEAHARRNDPETSKQAAASVTNLGEVRNKIIHMLGNWARTDEELWERYSFSMKAFHWKPCSPSGLRSRRAELVRMGLVEDSGVRAKTASGRDSIIWRLK